MKHDLEAFSRDIVTLIKKSGDSGGSGDKSKKSLRDSDFFVPTRETVVSPVASNWGHEVLASGDRKGERLQPVVSSVPSVPTATAQIREGLSDDAVGHAPAEWHAILAELERQNSPDWLSPTRWCELLSDAEIFLSRWGNAAHSLGWTALDLFGVHPRAPASRFDVMGLLMLIQAGTVVALTTDAATIRRQTGAVLTYRRCTASGAVLISVVQ